MICSCVQNWMLAQHPHMLLEMWDVFWFSSGMQIYQIQWYINSPGQLKTSSYMCKTPLCVFLVRFFCIHHCKGFTGLPSSRIGPPESHTSSGSHELRLHFPGQKALMSSGLTVKLIITLVRLCPQYSLTTRELTLEPGLGAAVGVFALFGL
jgi:hypothetical protein